MSEFKPVSQDLPENNQVVDWVTSTGDEVSGGKFYEGLWFLPPDHRIYCYYKPISWRPAEE